MKWLARTLTFLGLLAVLGLIALLVWRWLYSRREEEEILLVTEVGTISRVKVASRPRPVAGRSKILR